MDVVWDRQTRSYMSESKQRRLDRVRMARAQREYNKRFPVEPETQTVMGAMVQAFAALSYYDRKHLGIR
jgi:hypothetical protein